MHFGSCPAKQHFANHCTCRNVPRTLGDLQQAALAASRRSMGTVGCADWRHTTARTEADRLIPEYFEAARAVGFEANVLDWTLPADIADTPLL